MKANQKFPVYSAPDAHSFRGAKGKASVSTNGAVYAAGWEEGWLLLMYLTNNGSVRVGYADGSRMKGAPSGLPMLEWDPVQVTLQEDANLTDDPVMAFSTLAKLQRGSQVTYLTEYQNRYAWAYVETMVDGQWTRGFIAADALGADAGLDAAEDAPGK